MPSRAPRALSPILVGLMTTLLLLSAGCVSTGEGSSDASPRPGAGAGLPEPEASTEEPTLQLKVSEVGWGQQKGYDYIEAVAIIENPSKWFVSMRVRFAAYDSGGDVLAQSESSTRARGGGTIAISTGLEAGKKKIAKVTARATVDLTEDDLDPAWKLTPSGVKYRKGEFDAHSATGKVASTYAADISQAEVTAVCRNSSGKIAGAGVAYVDIGAGESAPVEANVTGTGIKKCEFYPTLGLATEF